MNAYPPIIDSFSTWLAAYGRAWETHDAVLISQLFAEDALYFIKPFDEPLRGRAAIVEYWRGIAQTQAKVRFSCEVLAVTERGGLAHWSVTFQRVKTGKWLVLDGVLLAELNDNQGCTLFREWWHRQENNRS